ncbi:hypothetical protein E4U47_004552 [Claviceps purpurea]|nr:hypothetical protein E4U51_001023 [Claviceps purpurea]KAG6191665.1 hypothetical protein E4U10_004438 [Claviceps purpurea]KAG6278922.1 hypothetical protein E4U47_004552 [Claviceps purpurea]KAG6289301.1 hypothetical protein E4U46_002651 [Claviceps purpurea]
MLCTTCRAARQRASASASASLLHLPRHTTPVLRRPTTTTTQYTSFTRPRTPRFFYHTTPPQRQPQQASPEQPSMSPAEESIAERLRKELQPTELLVRDVSGGCGSMYAIDIASPAFKGLSMLKQQRMVNAALGELMRGWHGVQLNTRVSK